MVLAESAEAAVDQLMRSKERLVLIEAHERIGPIIQHEPINCEIMVLPGKENLAVHFMLQKSSQFRMAIDKECAQFNFNASQEFYNFFLDFC
jgi:hypothetical protein